MTGGKYSPIEELLQRADGSTVKLSFNEIASLTGGLPASAHLHRAWWANEHGGRHVQSASWLDAGFRVSDVQLGHEVTFERLGGPRTGAPTAVQSGDPRRAWPWEGAVQAFLVAHLEATGWSVVRQADAARRTHGPDIDARRLGHMLLVEVKGYPSTAYADPRRSSEQKPTRPKLQARHWFAQALLKAIELHDRTSGVEAAIALPDDFDGVYEALVQSCERTLTSTGVGVYFIEADGAVSARIPHSSWSSLSAASDDSGATQPFDPVTRS